MLMAIRNWSQAYIDVISFNRVATGQGKVWEIWFFIKVRESQGILQIGQGNFKYRESQGIS